MALIAYLAHDVGDAAVGRRAGMLRAAGATVVLAGFYRADDPPISVADIAPLLLGRTEDARLLARAAQVGRVLLLHAGKLRRAVEGADAIIARNLEMLLIAAAVARGLNPRPRLIYECLDIHRLLTAPGLRSGSLRALERRIGARVDAVLTSSPAFVRHHFHGMPFAERVHLVENRVFVANPGAVERARPRSPGPPWRIGWFGALRCRRSFELLTALAQAPESRVEVVLRGRPSRAVFTDLTASVSGMRNVRFAGPYRWPDDLSAIYHDVHFSWCGDFYEAGANSEWLLPNRLYESGLFGAVPIALEGSETSHWLASRGLGEVIGRSPETSLPELFAEMTPGRYQRAFERIISQPRTTWLADRAACIKLLDVVLGRPVRLAQNAA